MSVSCRVLTTIGLGEGEEGGGGVGGGGRECKGKLKLILARIARYLRVQLE